MTLIVEQPNVIQVFEFREIPEPRIIMDYYSAGNIVDAGVVDEDRYVSALGQILDGLSHLHAKVVAHRDLKPENFLVEKKPFFKVVVTDFGLSKVVTNTTLLTTFCGTLKYLAPEVFPGLSDGPQSTFGPWASSSSKGCMAFQRPQMLPSRKRRRRSRRSSGTIGSVSGPRSSSTSWMVKRKAR